MKPSVYVETSIISYLTSRPSRNRADSVRQRTTKEWFRQYASRFELIISELVEVESRRGDPDASARRLAALESMKVVPTDTRALEITELLIERGIVLESVPADAMHIAMATVGGADYLLTWNCKHIANATIRNRIEELLGRLGWACPIICTPDVLLED